MRYPHVFEATFDQVTYDILLAYRERTGCSMREALRRAVRLTYCHSQKSPVETREAKDAIIQPQE
jgi:hypothetical protein